jgi:hypothetical protein
MPSQNEINKGISFTIFDQVWLFHTYQKKSARVTSGQRPA